MDTKRVMSAVTIDASGKMVLPMLILKGAPNGPIAKHESITCPDHDHYACQEKSQMDEDMIKWINLIFIPCKNLKVPGFIPIIILDASHVHMMEIK